MRQAKGVSAHDMSLSLGQSAGYINNIENGVNLPSMSTFFYICEIWADAPEEFLQQNSQTRYVCCRWSLNPAAFSSRQLELLEQLVQEMK